MAKFKVGDRVRVEREGKDSLAKVVALYPKTVIRFDSDGAEFQIDGSELRLANSRACRSTNPVVANALAARNYAYSHDPVKLMIQYAKKEDYGGIMDFTRPEEAESMGLYPADVVRSVYAKASKYYAGGRNMATPAQTQELVGLISRLRIKGINARGTARNATKSMTLIPSKDGNKLNDFIHYAYFTADGKWNEGDIPYVRKDLLVRGLEEELNRARTRMQAIADALKEAKAI